MKTYTIPNTDLTVSRIAYGCASLVGWDSNSLTAADRARAQRLIHTAYEHGITLFDHADVYTFGKSEAVFGEVLKASRGLRHKIIIQSKCGQIISPNWQIEQPIRVELTREHIVSSLEGSLKRLATDHLDILLLHAPSTLVGPEEVAEAFDQLYRSGKVRYFGVSNHSAVQVQLLRKAVRQPIIANQIHLGLGYPDVITDGVEFTIELAQAAAVNERYIGVSGAGTFDYCRLHDIQIQAWSPLRGDLLSPNADSPPGLRAAAQRLTEIAKTKQSTPAAVALAWLLHHPARILPITGPSTAEHIIENCAADRVTLSNEEWYDLLAVAADIKSRVVRHS
jgi:predicted oxidoreductase